MRIVLVTMLHDEGGNGVGTRGNGVPI